MKRALAWACVILIWGGMVGLTVLLMFNISWYALEQYAKAMAAAIFITSPSVRYLRRTPAARAKLRELRDIDRRLDEIDGKQ